MIITLQMGERAEGLRKGDKVCLEGTVQMNYAPYTDIEVDDDSVQVSRCNLVPGDQCSYGGMQCQVIAVDGDDAWVKLPTKQKQTVSAQHLTRL